MTRVPNEVPLFPNSAFVNINYLGLSSKSRFDTKLNYIRNLLNTSVFLGIQELHTSPAKAQDLFFVYFPSHAVLYNTLPGCPGQTILIDRSWLAERGIHALAFESDHTVDDVDVPMDTIEHHHCIFIPSVAHGFWWHMHDRVHLFINVYLDAHDASTRVNQLRTLTGAIRNFQTDHANCDIVHVIGGDRNFVVRHDQHVSDNRTDWWPGDDTMHAWQDLLRQVGAHCDTELDEPTWSRKCSTSTSSNVFVARVLDFAFAAYDPVRHGR